MILVIGVDCASSQESADRPKIETKQKADRPITTDGQARTKAGEAKNPNLLVAQPHPEAAQTDASEDARKRGQEASEYWVILGRRAKATDWLLVLFTGLLVAGNTLLWLTTRKAANAAKLSAEIAEKALIDLERAVVVLKEIHRGDLVKDPKTGEDYAMINVEIENGGSTRTRHLIVHVAFKVFPLGELTEGNLPVDFDYPDVDTGNEPASFVIGPKATNKLAPFGIPLGALERMGKEEARGYMWGWVEYDDIFAGTPRHRTEFCVWARKVTPPYSAARIEWAAYKHHNGMDEECPPERFRTTKGGVWIEPRRSRIPAT